MGQAAFSSGSASLLGGFGLYHSVSDPALGQMKDISPIVTCLGATALQAYVF